MFIKEAGEYLRTWLLLFQKIILAKIVILLFINLYLTKASLSHRKKYAIVNSFMYSNEVYFILLCFAVIQD